jgi:RNA polymerase sigma-70 factor (ECF subfamily)
MRAGPATAVRAPRRFGSRQAALALVDALGLDGFALAHSIRAEMLRRLGRRAEAAQAYEAAIALTENAAERAFLLGRLGNQLGPAATE